MSRRVPCDFWRYSLWYFQWCVGQRWNLGRAGTGERVWRRHLPKCCHKWERNGANTWKRQKLTCWIRSVWLWLFGWLQLWDQMSVDPGSILFIERNKSVVLKFTVVFDNHFAAGRATEELQLLSQMKPFALSLIALAIAACHDGHQSDDDYDGTDDWRHDGRRFFVVARLGSGNRFTAALELFFSHQRNCLQNEWLGGCVGASVGALNLPLQNGRVGRIRQLLQSESLKCQ